MEKKNKMKINNIEEAASTLISKAKKTIKGLTYAAMIASVVVGCSADKARATENIEILEDQSMNNQDETKLMETLTNFGIDAQIIETFKNYIVESLSNGITFKEGEFSNEEMASLGVTFENDGVQLPAWWTDKSVEDALLSYRDFLILNATLDNEQMATEIDLQIEETETEVIKESETETIEESETETIEESETETIKESETEEQVKKEVAKPKTAAENAMNIEIKNFGDATDDAQVTEKANKVLDYYNQSGIVNLRTGNPYTIDEIKDIILFMNAAYMPEDEADAFSIVDRFLDFVCGPLSSMQTLDMVNYMANSDVVTKEMVEEDLATLPEINWVDSLLMGDSYCYPYLEWFNDKYNTMMRTTDREEFIKIYNELTQSLADLLYGDGYTINGVSYTINNFSGLGDINDGSLLHMFGLMYQVGRVEGVQEDYTIQNRQAGEATVNIEDILRLLNVECAEDIAKKAEYDTEGNLVFPTIDGSNQYSDNLDNPFMRWETNAINASIQNLYLGNLNAYEDNYNLSLKK